MAQVNTYELCTKHLFTQETQLRKLYTDATVERLLRIRDMYLWQVANPESKDRQFIEVEIDRYAVAQSTSYDDLRIVKKLLPQLTSATRDFHRWRANEMFLETYQMSKKRKDTKTMEKVAASYAKYNRVDLEDEVAVPYELIVIQPFVPTSDPSVLGIKPTPNIRQKITAMLEKYTKETIDIEDVSYEEADLEEDLLFPESTDDTGVEDDSLNLDSYGAEPSLF